MILVRSPLRITLGGGGTDVPAYYREHGGHVVAAAIDQYVYVTVTRPFFPGIYLKYSELEHVQRVDQIQHPIIRAALARMGDPTPQIEITTLADIPAGTGLGSSSSFTCALVRALSADQGLRLPPRELARRACEIEIDDLGAPIGKQDHFISAYGGLMTFGFHDDADHRDEYVDVAPVDLSPTMRQDLEDHLLLFFTGITRSASAVLAGPMDVDWLHTVKARGYASLAAIERGDGVAFARLMNEHWQEKARRQPLPCVDRWYALARQHGALGGKLVGAGGGGFLLLYVEDARRVRAVMQQEGLREVRFRFDREGTSVVV
jgi:D-glycero-alpha-D-manno-heptose-7-phosphate kinase